MDATLTLRDGKISENLTVLPLLSVDQKKLGLMIMIEDIRTEKRMKATMSNGRF
jgi:adenylate cyclase